jgi:hypothetical protein
MTRISSGQTFYMKRILPLMLVVVIGLPIFIAFTVGRSQPPIQLLAMPIVMLPIFFVIFRKLVWDLVDTVDDGGDYLLVKKGDKEERILLSNIMNVSSTLMVNPPRVTLRLVTPGRFGKEIVFSPKRTITLNPFARNEITESLIERVDKARRGPR